jgi:hypothetical protein
MKYRKVKQVLPSDGYRGEKGGQKQRVKEDEYGKCILHSCMEIEQ